MKASLTFPAAQRRRIQIAQVFNIIFSDTACLAVIAAFTCAMFLHICAADDMLQLQNSIGRDLALTFPWGAVLAVRTSIRLFREGGER